MDEFTALRTWDAAATRGATRAAEMVAALRACDPADLWDLPLAELDHELLRACRALGGHRLELEAECPGCGAQLDLGLDLDAMLATAPGAEPETSFRAPTTRALTAVEGDPDPAEALWRWCTSDATDEGGQPPDRTTAAERLGNAAPLLAPEITAECPDCDAMVEVTLEPAGCLAQACEGRASGLLREVALLAQRTGWSERTILAMSTRRRRRYLELIDA